MMPKIDIEKPRFDQSTYWGRAKHFFVVTNPLNLFATPHELDHAANVVKNYRATGILPPDFKEDELWRAKQLYDSAYHPDTGEKMFVLGRMSAQVPMNTIITGCMICFYKTTQATIFWQWINQSFNALVNYTNRSGDTPISTTQLATSYTFATSGALGTALYLNKITKSMSPIWGRLVPFAAVAAANCINIPLMRSNELMEGTPIFTEDGDRVGSSTKAAGLGISLVAVSRILMSTPSMTLTPFIANLLQKKGFFDRNPRAQLPIQLGLVALCLTFATPLCCALFEQRASIKVTSLEPDLQEEIKKKSPNTKEVFFNKGL